MNYGQAANTLDDLAAKFREEHDRKLEIPRGGMTLAEFSEAARALAGNNYFSFGLTVNCHPGSPDRVTWNAYGFTSPPQSFTGATLAALLTKIRDHLAEPSTIEQADAALPV